MFGKLPNLNFNVSVVSNSRDKVLILAKSKEHIGLKVFLLFRTFSPGLENNNTLKCNSESFPTTAISGYCWKFLEPDFILLFSPTSGDKIIILVEI